MPKRFIKEACLFTSFYKTLLSFLLLAISSTTFAEPTGEQKSARRSTSEEQKSLELLTASQRMDKREMLKNALDLNQTESDRFWPIYYEYQAQLIPIYDRKFALIEQYADDYPKLSERQADHLVRESLAAKKQQIELLQTYYTKVARALSKNIAARFVQLESAWNGAFDVKLLSRLPLIPSPSIPAKH